MLNRLSVLMCQSLVKIVNQIINTVLNNVDEIPTIVQVG